MGCRSADHLGQQYYESTILIFLMHLSLVLFDIFESCKAPLIPLIVHMLDSREDYYKQQISFTNSAGIADTKRSQNWTIIKA